MSLTNKTTIGILWNFMDQLLRRGMASLVTLLLARLLVPEDFGLMAMVLVFLTIASAIMDSGLQQAILRMPTLGPRDASTAFFSNIAAARAPSDQPLTYRVRVRVPEGASKFRVAYSSLWPSRAAGPQWYGAVPMPGGESIVTIRVLEDPRDKKWKIASLVSSVEGNQRMATVLPPKHDSDNERI